MVGVAVDAAMVMVETAEWLVVLVCSRGFMMVVCMLRCWDFGSLVWSLGCRRLMGSHHLRLFEEWEEVKVGYRRSEI